MSYSVAIVDDEVHARNYLREILGQFTELNIIAEFGNGIDLIDYCQNHTVDLIFLDIEMPGINGIQAASSLLELQASPFVIFTTAYEEYAISAFEVEAIGYVLKPYQKDDLEVAFERFKKMQGKDFSEQLKNAQQISERTTENLEYMIFNERGLEHKVWLEHVLYFASDSEYVKVYLKDGFKMKRLALRWIETKLSYPFIRIHRSHLINFKQVQDWKYLNNNTYSFTFSNGQQLTSSRSYFESIKKFLSTTD